MTKFRNIYKCECGNHEFFNGLEKSKIGSTFETVCGYCMKRKILQFVKSRRIEN